VTLFDFMTVACFLAMVGGFFTLTTQQPRTLLYLLLVAIAFAVANQLGNAGYDIFASILLITGIGSAILIIRQG